MVLTLPHLAVHHLVHPSLQRRQVLPYHPRTLAITRPAALVLFPRLRLGALAAHLHSPAFRRFLGEMALRHIVL